MTWHASTFGDDFTHTKKSWQNLFVCCLLRSTNHYNPFNPNPNWHTTAINIGTLQAKSTSLPPDQVLVIFKLIPSSFAIHTIQFPWHPNISVPSPPVVMVDLESSWKETRYKPWSPETKIHQAVSMGKWPMC